MILLLAGAAVVAVAAAAAAAIVVDGPSRQEQVAERGARVMPFSLEATTHVFDGDARGGIQRVIAKDRADAREVRLIREHLSDEARAFRRGDFSDPASIHGTAMPGLDELRAGYRSIAVGYREVPGGAAISYRTTDARLASAIRAWFDAQLRDHGAHATSPDHSGHPGGGG